MPVKQLFPTSIYTSSLTSREKSNLNKSLLRETRKIQEIDIEGNKWSAKNYLGGYTSYGSLDHLHKMSPTFADLERILDVHVKKYVKALGLELKRGKIKMDSCWVNVMKPMVHHSLHIHPLSVISGTYYLKVPKKSAGIKFEDPRMVCFMASPKRKNKLHFELMPKEGQFVLFESWLRHEVPANSGTQDRISISFNYNWE
ncbi:MAG: hypothetical protein A4S09_04665 [Proteobacteria bacterium SG_bin7]|nr:MAG: hypothetical protein A4S09_04665 [Proteobacteria bacterium SG_bin7]